MNQTTQHKGNIVYLNARLDVNTPRGQQTLRDEEAAVRLFESHFDGYYRYIPTDKRGSAFVDAVLIDKRPSVAFVVETKCRYDVMLPAFQQAYRNEWLLTNEKLVHLTEASRLLQVPALGFLYLVHSKALLVVKLCNRRGELIPNVRVQDTRTRETVNGGTIVRKNAFIDMSTAALFQ